ncbi:MAG: hypothetical protein IKC45_02635 [Clostridia bacterium]|nr:hypothetical protein [Clostridia bacterium]
MTSQKSLNNVNRNDFVRSLKESLLFPVIAFIVLFFFMTAPVISYVTNEDFLMQTVHNEISVFLTDTSSFYYMFAEIVPAGMVACGMLTAAKSFYYLVSKKQVNVFLSLGVKRNTMLKNRILSVVITLFTAVFVPMLIIYITNIVNFGMSAHLTKVFLYVTTMLFVSGLIGFALASLMFMVSGNIFEAAFSTIALSLTPFLAFEMIDNLSHGWLKGYIYTAKFTRLVDSFNPWTMATNLQDDYIGEDESFVNVTKLLRPLISSGAENYKIPEQYNVDMGFVLPVIGWLVVALVVIGVTFLLYNRRKAEHANSLGKFAVSRAVVGTAAFVVVAWFLVSALSGSCNLFLLFLAIVVASFIAYAVVQLVLVRRVKTAFKSFKWYGVLVAVTALCLITIGTGIFGTYNKIPDIKEVKSVSVSTNELEMFPHFIDTYNDRAENFVESSTEESKKMVLELFELLKNEKTVYNGEWAGEATLAIRDNEGKLKYRRFTMYSEETYRKYLELVYGSDFIDAIFKNYLVDDIPENPYEDSSGYFKKYLWQYSNSDMLLKADAPFVAIEDVDGLGEALYKDLSAMSVEQLLKNNEKPVCILARGYEGMDFLGEVPVPSERKIYPIDKEGNIIHDKEYKPEDEFIPAEYGLLYDYIPVYKNMTNTLELLNTNGCITDEKQLTIKEVLYTDSFMDYNKASYEFVELNKEDNDRMAYSYSLYYPDIETKSFEQVQYTKYRNDNIAYFIDETMTEYEFLKKVYKDIGHPLESVTETEKAQKIFDNTVSRYMYLGDQGRFVYVVYEEGPIVCYYLPEANVSVVK